ncbi:NAD(P)-binding protein [Bacillaceae bacterium IKA-2]|nr:NAD(P)-binding protein [Bacillaceae bacterium IKA-2]
MLKNYPVNLQLKNKSAVIVGGGVIAERKLLKLLETEANITIVSPGLTEKIRNLAREKKVCWEKKLFSKGDLSKAFLVIAATSSKQVNREVFESCHEHQLINVVDDPKLSNFILPSTLHRGKLSIAVSTSGASPSLAKKIISELSEQFDDTYEDYLDFLGHSRVKIQVEIEDPAVRWRILQKLLEKEFLQLSRNNDREQRQKRFEELLQSEWESEL